MLQACALEFTVDWEKCLPYAEFAYNNSFQLSLKMSPFEALYGRKHRTPLHWSESGEGYVFGPNTPKQAEEKVRLIRYRLQAAQSRQKSYTDNRRRGLTFEVIDDVYLKVSPLHGTRRFKLKAILHQDISAHSPSLPSMEK